MSDPTSKARAERQTTLDLMRREMIFRNYKCWNQRTIPCREVRHETRANRVRIGAVGRRSRRKR
jgi:hypothetical protein